MSRLYKRGPYFWWEAYYKGRRFQRSTKMTRKDLAKQITDQWDMKLVLDDTSFLNLKNQSPTDTQSYFKDYLIFVEKRKSENTLEVTMGVLKRFESFLESKSIVQLDEITVRVMDGYIDWLNNAPKTKKNYLGIISIMLKQAIKEGVISTNPAVDATLPRILKNDLHRMLEPIDLEIIFSSAVQWFDYYQFLYHTGLRAGDVALLTSGNIDRHKPAIINFIRKSRRIHEFPIADHLLSMLPKNCSDNTPLFPNMFADTEKKLNWKLKAPRKHMQSMLRLNGRSKATLQSFRTTFNNVLRDLGLPIGDRQILLAHASSETTKIYTHPNFKLASEYVNKIPVYGNDPKVKM